MDKVIINNQIVLMRKFVKQAKIRAINNYTKEIRLLQNRKGNDDETSKHKRKAERLLSKVVILRKIQPDAVSRKALSKEKDWKDVLKEKNIPLEDQCYAMLANYGPVQSEVEKFHKTHWDLVPKISALFKSWEEKSKNPIIKQEKKKAKELRQSLKAANVKLGRNNSNATPIGPNIKDNMVQNISQTESPLNTLEKNENCNLLNESSDNMNAELNNKHIQNDTTAMTLKKLGTDEEATNNEKEEIKESKNTLRKSLIKRFLKKKLKKDENKTDLNVMANKEKLKESLLKQTANSDIEENDLESDANSLDIDSEDNDIEDKESMAESHESDEESETEEIPEDAKETMEENKVAMKQNPNLKTPKPASIQAKLKAIGDVKQKTNLNEKRNSSLKEKVNSDTKQETSNLKAVTMLNLNELEGLDEIPIEKTDIVTEDTGEKKRKRDPFFLGKEGEVVSESENEDSISLSQGTDDHDFKRRKFNNNFERKLSDGDFFRKRNFPEDAPQNRKPGFRDNSFQKNKRNLNFADKSNSFQNRGKPSLEFHKDKGFKAMPKDQFQNKKEFKSFGDRPFARKQKFHQEPSNKAHFQKNKLSSPLKKSSNDDKPLHPSWEAKKKLKESAKAKFQGKRIVFGD